MKIKFLAGVMAAAGLLALPGLASATNGYFSHGYGIKAKGMAGVGIAYGQDALAAATNPANMVLVGNRWDVGVDWFRPQRESTIVGSAGGVIDGTFRGDETENFLIPEFGYNQMLNPNMSVGVSVYGNGGMNTDYANNPFAAFGGSGNAGVDLMQLFVAPTFSMKVAPQHAVGVSLNLAYQRFKAYGIQGFSGFSASPGDVSNRGYDDSYGWGVRVGYTGQLTPTFAVGATYQSKTWMSKFDKYKGLFAEQGDFDIPENYGVGFAWKATPQLTIAGDVQWIKYSGVDSVSNRVDCLFAGACQLGASNGAGFGWEDMTVYKLGVSYAVNKNLTLRAGYSTTDQPIPPSQTFFNILAPGVVEDHLTLGGTWTLANGGELSFAYMHAFKKTVNGAGSIPLGGGFPGGEANLRMYENSFGVAYGMKF